MQHLSPTAGGTYRLQEWVENKRSAKFHRFDLGDAGGSIESRVGDLCNHVGFTDEAAP
jgi:hypothetical protein